MNTWEYLADVAAGLILISWVFFGAPRLVRWMNEHMKVKPQVEKPAVLENVIRAELRETRSVLDEHGLRSAKAIEIVADVCSDVSAKLNMISGELIQAGKAMSRSVMPSEGITKQGEELKVLLHEINCNLPGPVFHETQNRLLTEISNGVSKIGQEPSKEFSEWAKMVVHYQTSILTVLNESYGVEKQVLEDRGKAFPISELTDRLDKIGSLLADHLVQQKRLARTIEGKEGGENEEIAEKALALIAEYPQLTLEDAISRVRRQQTYSLR